ncbi:MAG: PEP-utilizing enzyme [Candidatus Buchananbacteria bacterium]
MIYKKGLIKSQLAILKEKEWYHQRFDGCPGLMFLIGQMELKPEKRKGPGGEFVRHLVIYSQNRVDWYMDLDDLKRISGIFIKKSSREPYGIGQRLMKKWDKDKKALANKCQTIDKIDLSKLSDDSLKATYRDFVQTYLSWTTMSSLIDGFALGSDQFIQNELKKILDNKKIDRGQGIIFSTLTAPVNQSFINEAEISLLKVAAKISKNIKLKKIFEKNNSKIIAKQIKDYPKEYQALINHQQQYFWSKNNYVDANVLSTAHFIKEIKGLLKSKINIDQQIVRISNTPKHNQISKQKLSKELSLPKYLINLIEISETFTYWQDERKRYTFWATHYYSIFLKEIGQRFGYALNEMKYLLFEEVLALFDCRGHYVSPLEAKQRIDFCFHYDYKNSYETLSGLAARKFQKIIFPSNVKKDINDFRGLSASSGKAKGTVRIVKSVHEVNKVKSGDILVAVMTRPDYIVGIKKAAAIVTNEGGVTCHAAIVARELGIPCVIATKIATEVLKDGDLVEVNGNHGVVTILKRK